MLFTFHLFSIMWALISKMHGYPGSDYNCDNNTGEFNDNRTTQ